MMTAFADIVRRLAAMPVDNPELLKAQYAALAQQMPVFYFVLLVSTWALAAAHFGSAPLGLTVGVSSLLTVISLLRARFWWRARHCVPSTPQMIRHLTLTYRVAAVISAAFCLWAFSLYPYGGSHAQAQVTFFLIIMLIACIFCTMHLRPAALGCTAILNIAFVSFVVSTGDSVYIVTAINYVLVSAAMLVVMQNHYRDFSRLADMQVQTARLGNENRRLANEDSLTGLPNRRQFFISLEAALHLAEREGRRLAVGILDLDGFKPVNDIYGHSLGDRLLVQVGQRLLGLADAHTHVARLGGDEFALIFTAGLDDTALAARGAAICRELKVPFLIVDVAIQIGASLGIATYPDVAGTADELYEFADYALYQSKRRHTGAECLFSPQLHTQLHSDSLTEQALRTADLEAQLHVVFQPILDCATGRTLAFEALARWTSPQLGAVSPVQFIPVAERTGMITELTLPLLRKALQAALSWPPEVRLAFNLSAHDCASPDSVQAILQIIASSGVEASRLDLEITETAIMQDLRQVQRAVMAFRKVGCGISLDDFGTGYSSLSQLHEIALTKLKIDRSFISHLHLKPASYKIVKSLIALSEDMGVECVVEGVETLAELTTLRALGATWVQGFLFSRPVTFDQTLSWLARAPDDRWVAEDLPGAADLWEMGVAP